MKKNNFNPPLRNSLLIGGGSVQHLVDPYGRDTTRGTPENDFPTLHNDEVVDLMEIANCECCGVNFGFRETAKPPKFCPSHRWLEKSTLAGHLNVVDVSYEDERTKTEVSGKRCTMVYTYDGSLPEWKPSLSGLLMDAIDAFLDGEPIKKKYGFRVPEVFYLGEEAIIIRNIQRVAWDDASSTNVRNVVEFLQALDKIYFEVM